MVDTIKLGEEIVRLATELKHEIHYVRDVLETSMHSWADRKISDARFYSRVKNAIADQVQHLPAPER